MSKSNTSFKKLLVYKKLFFVMFTGIFISCDSPNLNQEEDLMNKNSFEQRSSSLFENVEVV